MKKKIFYYILLVLIMSGCRGNQESNSEDLNATETEHDHEEIKIQFTAYNSEFEVFAEADGFVTGKKSNVLSHFTNLSDFSPLESGNITIQLNINGKQTVQTLEKPTRKGIYSFDIQPENSGVGQIIYDIKTDKGDFQLVASDITVYATEEEADEAAEAAVPSKTNTTVFTKEQTWKIGFATELPTIEPFGQIIKTTAQVQSTQGNETILAAKTNGIVLISGNNILEGESISSGQVLFTISGSGLANNNSSVRFLEAKNNYEKTTSDYERSKELAKDKIVSEKDLLNAKNQYDNAKVIFDNLNKNFNATGQRVASPINGFIKQLFVQNGQYVEAGQPIATVSQNKTLVLHADLQQKFASILGTINSANIGTLYDKQIYSLEQLNGKILSYGKSTNANNYLIPINLQIDNKGSFIPGSFVELYLKTLTNAQALTIASSALLEEQGIYFVFVQITPELFEKREVKTGATDGFKTEIIEGLIQNERVVSKGAILIKLAQSTGTLDAHSGHVH